VSMLAIRPQWAVPVAFVDEPLEACDMILRI